jgi:hypothetical protein
MEGGQRCGDGAATDRRGRSRSAANAVLSDGATGRAAGGVRCSGGVEWCDGVLSVV